MTRPVPPPCAWDPAFADRSPAFEPLQRSASKLGSTTFPSIADLQRLADSALPPIGVGDARRPLRVVALDPDQDDPYERRVFLTGEVPVRTANWHDLFNVLAWLSFPHAKAALNARHVSEMPSEMPGRRGRVRDALTQFDEDGMIVLSSAPDLLGLVRAFRWKDLFWTRRDDVSQRMRFLVFGHALYEKLLTPFIGVTGRAVLLDTEPELFAASARGELGAVDLRLAQRLAASAHLAGQGQLPFSAPAELAPVPVLGIPGWFAANRCESFYDDTTYFRSGRRVAREGPTRPTLP